MTTIQTVAAARARCLRVLLLALLWLMPPLRGLANSCEIGFMPGTTIADGNINGVIRAGGNLTGDWADASAMSSGSPCLGYLPDVDVAANPTTEGLPTLSNVVNIFSKRDAGSLYMAFEVQDQTANRRDPGNVGAELSIGEKVIVLLDPSHSGGTQLLQGADALHHDYKITVTYKRGGAPATAFYDSSGTTFGSPSWASKAMPGLISAASSTATGYVVTLKIPLSLIGSPGTDIGVACAVINDLGWSVMSGGGVATDATGLAFPTDPTLSFSNALLTDPIDPTASGGWKMPVNWATGAFTAMSGSVTIKQTPVYWESDAITCTDCNGNPSYLYYPQNPCKLKVSAQIDNTSTVDQTKNILFLWADNGPSPSIWRVIDLQTSQSIVPGGTLVTSNLWSTVPTNLTAHPCVRVYILPAAFLPAFDKNAILNITTQAQLTQMEAVYNLTAAGQSAQKNISDSPANQTQVCPDAGCRVALADTPKVLTVSGSQGHLSLLPLTSSDTSMLANMAMQEPDAVKLHSAELVKQLRADMLKVDLRPDKPRILQRTGSRILLGSFELRRFIETRHVVQIRAFGKTTSRLRAAKQYSFFEDLGGMVVLFQPEDLKRRGTLPFSFIIANPTLRPQQITLQVDTRQLGAEQNIRFAVDTTPGTLRPGQRRLMHGYLLLPGRRIPLPPRIPRLPLNDVGGVLRDTERPIQ